MLRSILFSLAVLFLTGCPTLETGGYKDQRFAIKGTVTADGRPLENGTIAFIGTAEGSRQAGGPIVNGAYDIPEGQGPNAGKYRVEIRSLKPTGKKVKDSDTGGMIDVMVEALPPRYHDKSILTATIEAGKIEYPFELVTK
jgi:hypothetical protein